MVTIFIFFFFKKHENMKSQSVIMSSNEHYIGGRRHWHYLETHMKISEIGAGLLGMFNV